MTTISTPNFLSEALSNAKIRHFSEGDIVVDIDQTMDGLPLVISGRLKVYKEDDNDNEIFLYYLLPNDICSMGIKCCITEGRSQARVYADEDSDVLFVSKESIEQLQNNQEWNNFVIQSLANRVEELLEVADDLAFKKLDQRVLDYLNKKAELNKTKALKLTHKDISKDLNSSREVISRILKKLENEGAIRQQRNQVTLL